MFVEFKVEQEVLIASLPETLGKEPREELLSGVAARLKKKGRLVIDGSNLRALGHSGIDALVKVHELADSSGRLILVGFSEAVWNAIVEENSELIFSRKSGLAEAFSEMGLSAPGAGPEKSTLSSGSSRSHSFRRPASGDATPEALPKPVATAIRALSPEPARPRSDDGPPDGGRRMLADPMLRWSLVATLLLLLGTGAWWFAERRVPVIELSSASVEVEAGGNEVDEVTVSVQRGRLVEKSGENLPTGLYFEPPAIDSGNRTYTLRGRASAGAQNATVELVAANERGERSAPVKFTVNIKARPISWQLDVLQSLRLKAGSRVSSPSKFVVNAQAVSVRTGLPPGLTVERMVGSDRDWQLTGTPAAAGTFTAVFAAVSPTGASEERSCTLTIAGAGTAQALPAPEPPPANDLDGAMRSFLSTRIDLLPSHYPEKERAEYREMVSYLRQARTICTLHFEQEGKTDLSDEQRSRLEAALNSPENAAIIKDPNSCLLVVVGYASRTGSLAQNVRISAQRAQSVNTALRGIINRNADLCGDYGPTDVVDSASDAHNRAVEVYAGILDSSPAVQAKALKFQQQYNRSHGLP